MKSTANVSLNANLFKKTKGLERIEAVELRHPSTPSLDQVEEIRKLFGAEQLLGFNCMRELMENPRAMAG